MGISRIIICILLVLLFSWPVFNAGQFSPWFLWLYPFVIWGILIIATFLLSRNKAKLRNNGDS